MTSLYTCSGGGAYVHIGTTAPNNPADGTLWFNPQPPPGTLQSWNAATKVWAPLQLGGGGGAGIQVSTTDPGATGKPDGTGWLNPTTGELKVANNGAWVDASAHDIIVLTGPAPAPITATAGAVAGNAAPVTFAGGPADKAYSVTLTYVVDGAAPQVKTAALDAGDTADVAANKLVAATSGEIIAIKTALGALRVIVGTATTLTSLQITVA